MVLYLPRDVLAEAERNRSRMTVQPLIDDVQQQWQAAQQPEPPSFTLPSLESLGVAAKDTVSAGIGMVGQAASSVMSAAPSFTLPTLESLGVQQQQTPTPSGTPAAMPTAPGLVDATITAGPKPGQTLRPGESVGSVTLGSPPPQRTNESAPSATGDIDNSSRESFVRTAWPYMLEAAGGNRDAAEMMLAAAISENGSVGSGKPFWANNFYGLKGTGPAGSVEADTWEDYGNGRTNIRDKFKAFNTPQEGFRGFFDFLQENPRYHDALARYQQTGDATRLFQDVNAAGYATNKTWWQDVKSIRDNQVAPVIRQVAGDPRQSLNAGAGSPPAAPAAAGPGGVPPAAGVGSTMMMRASFEQPADDAGQDGGGIPRDPRRFIPTPNIVPLGPALRGQDTLETDEYGTVRGQNVNPNDPTLPHVVTAPVQPWIAPGTRNRPVPGGVSEWQDTPDPQPYGPFDPAERNRPVPGLLDEYGGDAPRNRYPNIIRDERQMRLPPTVAQRWQQRVAAPMTDEDMAQLRALGVIA